MYPITETTADFPPHEPLPLSPIEGAFWRMDQQLSGAYRALVLFRIDGAIKAELLARGLRHLQDRHPKLRAVVDAEEDGGLHYRFEQAAPPIPYEIKDYGQEEFPWREETRRLLQRDFPATGPFAMVTVLRSRLRNRSDLLLTLHHAIADGLSAITLVDDLLTEYARAEGKSGELSRPALKAVTAVRARTSGRWTSRLWLIARFLRLQRRDGRAVQTLLPEAPDIGPQSQWEHWVFSREQTLALVRRCRKEQSSLGAALVAAVCRGLTDCLPDDVGLFKCQFPLNVRGELMGSEGPVTNEDLGCYVSIMNEFYRVPRETPFWDLARRAHLALEGFVRHEGPYFGYNMADVARRSVFKTTASRLMKFRRRVTLLANNYGVLNVKDAYGSLIPKECTLTFKNYASGPSLVIQGLVMGQRLNAGLAADGLDPEFWDRLQAAIHGHLTAAGSPPKPG